MKPHYTILSVLIRPEIQEKISVGLLFFDQKEIYFNYSSIKLRAAKDLLPESSFQLLKNTLNSIETELKKNEDNYSEKRGFKIFKNKAFDTTFTASYIDYLSRYSNNLLMFSAPKEILLELNEQNFKQLHKKYVDEFPEEPSESRQKPFDSIKLEFGEKINRHFDLQIEITHSRVKNLITPVRIDFSGKNKKDVYAQTVDFEATPATVMNHINSFIQLKKTYEINHLKMQDWVIAKEPSKVSFPKQHEIWVQLYKSPILNYLDLSESKKLIEYAEEHGVTPISQE